LETGSDLGHIVNIVDIVSLPVGLQYIMI